MSERGLAGAVRNEWAVRVTWPRRTRRLVRLYTEGQRRLAAQPLPPGRGDELEYSEPLVTEGQRLARELVAAYDGKHAASGLRILLYVPPFGAGNVWLSDLAACLRHSGVAVETLAGLEPGWRDKLETFAPNVFMSHDMPDVLRFYDPDVVADYKKRHGLFRFYAASNQGGMPPHVRLRPSDAWRLDLYRRGLSADVLFSHMHDDYVDLFLPAWRAAGVEYVSLPMAVNPMSLEPQVAAKDLDWALVSNNADGGARAWLTERYMSGMLSSYRGVLAGAGWGAAAPPLRHEEVPALMARARISPNPRRDWARQYRLDVGVKSFEAPALGCFVLESKLALLPQFFADDEVVSAADEREFMDKFHYYLVHVEERYAYLGRGMRRVFADHTYFQRVDELVDYLRTRV